MRWLLAIVIVTVVLVAGQELAVAAVANPEGAASQVRTLVAITVTGVLVLMAVSSGRVRR